MQKRIALMGWSGATNECVSGARWNTIYKYKLSFGRAHKNRCGNSKRWRIECSNECRTQSAYLCVTLQSVHSALHLPFIASKPFATVENRRTKQLTLMCLCPIFKLMVGAFRVKSAHRHRFDGVRRTGNQLWCPDHGIIAFALAKHA